MNNLQIFFKRNSSTILTILASIGVISTTALAISATPKALDLINEVKKDTNKDLTKIEIVKTAWKPYIPTIISGFSTILCIFGANYLNKRTQASLTSAYALLNNSYREYIEKNKELYGEEVDDNIKKEIANDNIDRNNIDIYHEDKLFFDYQTMIYFHSTFENVINAEKLLNQELAATGYVSIRDFYRFIGIDENLVYSGDMGWYDFGHYQEIKFEHQRVQFDDGLECWIIVTETPLTDIYNY